MRKQLMTILLLTCLAPAAHAIQVSFDSGAQLSGQTQITGVQNLVAKFSPGTEFVLHTSPDTILRNRTVHYFGGAETEFTRNDGVPFSTSEESKLGEGVIILRPRAEGATIRILGVTEFGVNNSAEILSVADGDLSGFWWNAGVNPKSFASEMALGAIGPAFVGRTASEYNGSGMSIDEFTWHNMEVECIGIQRCPYPGPSQTLVAGQSTPYEAYEFHSVSAVAQVTFRGPSEFFLANAPTLSAGIDGHLRLPQASSDCACLSLQDQTLSAFGSMTLEGVRLVDGRLESDVQGEAISLRIDENWVAENPWLASGAATVVAGAALAVLVKFLAIPLFTRLSKAEALEHPNRQRIYAYIQEHPGANFREVARMTGIASGTVRHHLTVLERSGHIVEHAHQGTVRLFENHGKFDHNWSDVVLLREAPLAQVHAWLQEHPQSPQKDILEAFEGLGWSRSTTQHRLARMVEGGVASVRLQGRLKIYSPVLRPAVRPVGLPQAPSGSTPG